MIRENVVSLGDYDSRELSDETSVHTGSESLVQQHFADEVDINVIMRRFGVTRSLPLGPATGVYGDFTGISDFDSAVERVRGARDAFMKLPADVRERFNNDPGTLIRAAEELPEAEFLQLYEGPPAVEVGNGVPPV